MSERTASSKALITRWRSFRRHFGMLAAAIAAVTVIGGCSGQPESSPQTAGPVDSSLSAAAAETSAAAAQTSAAASQSPNATSSLSSRNTDPLTIESVQPQFYQDYSFFLKSGSPVSQRALAAMNTASVPTLPPPGVTIANQEWIVLTVAGNSTAPVTINDMIVSKSCEKPPAGGTLFYRPTTGSGPFTVAPIYFDLSKHISIGQYYPGGASTIPAGGNFFAKEVITLRYQEPQTLAIFVTTTQYCSFTFELDVATVNGTVVERLSDHGQPFTITSDGEQGFASLGRLSFASYAAVYASHNGKFIRVNPDTYHGSGDPMSFPIS